MSSFVIEGGRKLSGEIVPQGAKNEALQVISATLLTDKPVTISNVPEIRDVKNLISLLQQMGVSVTRHEKGVYTFCASGIDVDYTMSLDFTQRCAALRGSVLVVGPLLGRFGKAYFPKPGGDKIGRRKVDTHIQGFINLGADYEYDPEKKAYLLTAPTSGLSATYMLLDEASVTGTANILMAAACAHGKTTIYNAACEPYVQQLCVLMCAMGYSISGIGSNLLTIEGGNPVPNRRDTPLIAPTQENSACSSSEKIHHRILPDMIEVGSFIGMAAITQSAITIKDVCYNNLGIIPESFRRLGIKLEQQGDDIYVPAQESYVIETSLDGSIMNIADAPWPGLTPDLLSVMLVVATQCCGSVLIHQKMFESRLFFVDGLIDMGAQIILCDPHRAVVIGHDHRFTLRANRMSSPDIRAGIAMLLAAMSAKGTSIIGNIEQIDRGYEDIDERLNRLGASITRVD